MIKNLKHIKAKKKWLFKKRSIFFFVSFIFIIWMIFFDNSSYYRHQELNDEIKKLHQEKKILKEQIKRDRKNLEGFNSSEGKIKFGREKYYFKKNNEDIFVIEYDTIQK